MTATCMHIILCCGNSYSEVINEATVADHTFYRVQTLVNYSNLFVAVI